MKEKSRARSDRPRGANRPSRPETVDGIAKLRATLAEAESTLRAFRNGEVDAIVVEGKSGPKIYTLNGAEYEYRILIESMNEGAVVLTRDGVILYANRHFARMVERPLPDLMGRPLYDVVSVDDRTTVGRLLKRPGEVGATAEVLLQRASGEAMPARVSIQVLPNEDRKQASFGMVVTDLTEFRRREELLREFSRGLVQAQEIERKRVATDLGDNIAQLLCSILVRCQLLADRLPTYETAFRAETVEFAKLLRTTANEVHRISTDLRPHGLEILGLVSAIRGVAAQFAERMGVSIEVKCAKMTARLPAGTELALYRILQEALRNVEQHAQARHVTVTLKRLGSLVQLTIKDDGIGFDTSELQADGIRKGRFGLLSMCERATTVGGSLDVNSRSSAGTEVRLSVPLSPKLAAG